MHVLWPTFMYHVIQDSYSTKLRAKPLGKQGVWGGARRSNRGTIWLICLKFFCVFVFMFVQNSTLLCESEIILKWIEESFELDGMSRGITNWDFLFHYIKYTCASRQHVHSNQWSGRGFPRLRTRLARRVFGWGMPQSAFFMVGWILSGVGSPSTANEESYVFEASQYQPLSLFRISLIF